LSNIRFVASSESSQPSLSKTDWLDIAVYGELNDDQKALKEEIRPLIQKAVESAVPLRVKVSLVLVGNGITSKVHDFSHLGPDRIFLYDHISFSDHNLSDIVIALKHFSKEYKPSVILFSSSDFSSLLAETLATELNLSFAIIFRILKYSLIKTCLPPRRTTANLSGGRSIETADNNGPNRNTSDPVCQPTLRR
jgi:electron transfer flavoprotein alpha subunit